MFRCWGLVVFWGGVARLGGVWAGGAGAGAFSLPLAGGASNRNRNISGHLVYARYINFKLNSGLFALPLGKT